MKRLVTSVDKFSNRFSRESDKASKSVNLRIKKKKEFRIKKGNKSFADY